MEITRYSAEERRNKPVKVLVSILVGFKKGHHLGYRFAVRNIKALYRQSILGFVWALIPPIVTALVWIFLRKTGVFSIQGVTIPYSLFVLSGMLLWQIFTEAIMAPLKSVLANRNVLIKIRIPHEALLISSFYELTFNTLVKLLIFISLLFFYHLPVHAGFIWFIPAIMALMLAGLSIGILLTPLGMLFTDVSRGISVVLPFLMLLSPVIYPLPTSGFLMHLTHWNTPAIFLDVARASFTGSASPLSNLVLPHLIFVIFILIISLFGFKLSMPLLIEKMGS